jgi:hypothetical protein
MQLLKHYVGQIRQPESLNENCLKNGLLKKNIYGKSKAEFKSNNWGIMLLERTIVVK